MSLIESDPALTRRDNSQNVRGGRRENNRIDQLGLTEMDLTLVIATQRSGSTLLCNDITSLGGVGVPDEHLLPLINESTEVCSVHRFRQLLLPGRDSKNNVGLKIMINHADTLSSRLIPERTNKYIVDKSTVLLELVSLISSFFDNTAIFSIHRESFEQAVSRYFAEMSGLYHIKSNEAVYDRPVEEVISHEAVLSSLSKARFEQIWTDLEEEKKVQRETCAKIGNALDLNYERLVAEPHRSAKEVREHCFDAGLLPQRDVFERWTAKVLSQNNYRQFVQALKSLSVAI